MAVLCDEGSYRAGIKCCSHPLDELTVMGTSWGSPTGQLVRRAALGTRTKKRPWLFI